MMGLLVLLAAQVTITGKNPNGPAAEVGTTPAGTEPGLYVRMLGSISVGGAADTQGTQVTMNGPAVCTAVKLAGQGGAGFHLAAGTVAATFTPAVSEDSTNGTNGSWTATSFFDGSGNSQATLVTTNPSSDTLLSIRGISGAAWARVCSSAWTAGTAAAETKATTFQGSLAAQADVTDRAGRLLGHVTVDNATLAVTQSGGWAVTQGGAPWSVSQSGAWSTGRTWSLLNTTDSVNAVQSGTWTVQQGGAPWSVSQSGAWSTGRTWSLLNTTDSVNAVQSGAWDVRSITGTVPLPSNAAQETGGNLATLAAKDFGTAANQATELARLATLAGTVGTDGSVAPTTSVHIGVQDTAGNSQPLTGSPFGEVATLTEPQVRRLLEQLIIQNKVMIQLLQQLKEPGPAYTVNGYEEAMK